MKQPFTRLDLTQPCLCSPFYGEDFYCEIPRSFRHLSFYVFDRDVFRRDSIIGRLPGCIPHFLMVVAYVHLNTERLH